MPMNCDTARDLLLDHVYGALDDGDDAALRAHLDGCAVCREELATARGQRDVLAAAARTESSGLKLTPPKPRIRWFTRRKIAAAAALLVACVGGALAWRSREISLAEERNPRVAVNAPTLVAPGEPAEFLVDVASFAGKPLAATVCLEVRDGDGLPVTSAFAPTDGAGRARVQLSAGVGRPGEPLAVGVTIQMPGNVVRRTTTLLVRDASHLVARVATDKPLYRPGEPVRVRAVALERTKLAPAGDVSMQVSVVDPQGARVAGQSIWTRAGVGAWEYDVPEDAPGGEYRIVLAPDDDAHPAFAPTEQKFLVRSYRVPRLKSDIELDRDSYGPGDSGEAALSVERAEGGVPAGAELEAVVTVDGKEVSRATQTLAASGRATVRFVLPKDIAEGTGQVAVVVKDGGNVETVAKTIPIALGRLDVTYFPEGGDLVAGLPNRVYFEVKEPKGKAADLVADVVDETGAKVAEARVDDVGMGRFALTPRAGATYRLVARKPAGIVLSGEFPVVANQGVTLRALDDVTAAGKPIRVEIAATSGGRHTIAAYCRDALIAQDAVQLAAGEARVIELKPTSDVGGVVRVTVFDAAGLPRAERLVSLTPPHRIDLEVKPAAATYTPGERVQVEVTSRDETGKAVPAILGACVVDDSVVKLADDEDTASFPLHFLLGMEVEDLEKADVYAKRPNAARAVDRLLGVQGWRRFAWKSPAEFVAKHPSAGPRVTAASVANVPQHVDNQSRGESNVESERRRIDAGLTRVGTTLACGLAFALAVVALATGSLSRRATPIVATLLACGVLVGIVAVSVPTMQSSTRYDPATNTFGVIAGADDDEGDLAAMDREMHLYAARVRQSMSEQSERLTGPYWDGLQKDPIVPFLGRRIALGTLSSFVGAGGGGGNPGRDSFRGRRLGRLARFQSVLVAGGATTLNGGGVTDLDLLSLNALERLRALGYVGPGQFTSRDEPATLNQLTVDFFGNAIFDRVYAHRHETPPDAARTDFTEVLYWNPLLVTDADGKARFEFDTSDSVTTFSVGVDAHDTRGALGTASAPVRNRVPFYLEPKLPVALSAGDVLRLPVVVANDTASPIDVNVDVGLKGDLLRNAGAGSFPTTVAAGTRGRAIFELVAQHGQGDVALTIAGKAAGLLDTSTRTIPIVPRGYPVDIARAGILQPAASALVHLPADLDRGTLSGSLRLYPSTLASLEDGLEAMLVEPHGCFEQVSSTNYPNVLVLQYLNATGQGSPETIRRAKDLLGRGYAMLTGYECKNHGYEWFGADPGHLALTAYGLAEFADMAKVRDVDPAMFARTSKWLLDKRDGEGTFVPNGQTVDHFGQAPKDITDAYCTWAITEADPKADLTKEVATLVATAMKSDDAYVVALAAGAARNRQHADAAALLARLASMQKPDGRFAGKTTSITSSTGINLDVETTSLAVLALVPDAARLNEATKAVGFLVGQRRNGGSFGATQATVLALRALVAHANASKHTSTNHDIAVTVNGKLVAQRHVAAGAPGTILFERELLDALVPGENRIEFTTTGGETLPWALALRYHALVPASDPACAIGVETKLAQDSVAEGETVRLDVTITNRRADDVAMTLARIGLPAGLEPRDDQLQELKKSGAIDFYETRPREVTLYLRGMAASQVKRVALDVVAAIPGDFEGPATSAYLYYGDDAKTWTAPLRCRIHPTR